MAKFNQKSFNQFILQNNVIGFFEKPIILKSGRQSFWYVNWRNVAEDVFLLDKLTDFVINFVQDLNLKPDCFYGVPEGATKLAIITQYKWAKGSSNYGPGSHILVMGRGKPKEHGDPKDKFFIGQPRGKIIVLEDVTTTGSALLDTIDKLSQISLKIIATISLTNRMELNDAKETVKEAVERKGVPYHQMSDGLKLLLLAYKKFKITKGIAEEIEKEFQKYGAKKLKFL